MGSVLEAATQKGLRQVRYQRFYSDFHSDYG